MRRPAVSLAALALLLAGCSGGGDGRSTVWLYHMEQQVQGPAPTGQLTCGPPQPRCPFFHGEPADVLRYQRRGEPAVGGTDFVAESARALGSTLVLELSPDGARRFRSFTRALAQEGRERGRTQSFVVAVDGEIVTFGGVDPRSSPDGLSGEQGLQLQLPSAAEAERIAAKLRG